MIPRYVVLGCFTEALVASLLILQAFAFAWLPPVLRIWGFAQALRTPLMDFLRLC